MHADESLLVIYIEMEMVLEEGWFGLGSKKEDGMVRDQREGGSVRWQRTSGCVGWEREDPREEAAANGRKLAGSRRG